jgi:FkbM family methyltransferase
MRFITVSPVCFEQWDFRNSVEKGIGGSETSTVENAWRLARRGHEVINYTDIPDDCPPEWRGTQWKKLTEIDYSLPGVWVLYRCPELIDKFDHSRTDQVLWLCAQDWEYPSLTVERVKHLDRLMVLCHAHRRWLAARQPSVAHKLWVTRNGIKGDLIAETEAAGVAERNYKRIMYASSPDRGLEAALKIFQRAKEFVPDLELHCTYGFNNMDKLIAQGATHMQRSKDRCMKLVEETGAIFHGRLTQHQLYQEWFKTAMNVYCTSFWETGYITGLESSAMGAIPIFSPIWAQGENLKHGIAVGGHPEDPGTIARFAAEVVRLARNPELQDEIRKEMMPDTRAKWDWEQFVAEKPGENWIEAAEYDLAAKSAGKPTGVPQPTLRLPKGMCDNADEEASRNRWLKLSHGDVFIDVGAADGSWSFPAAAQGATVYAFDPNMTRTHLMQLAKAAGLTSRIAAIRAVVLDTAESPATFTINGETETVPTQTLDLFAKEAKLDRVDFIKIDVEGGELSVLRGAADVIKTYRPRIMTEAHTETVAGVHVTDTDVTSLIDSLAPGYKHEVVTLTYQGKTYYHVFSDPRQ